MQAVILKAVQDNAVGQPQFDVALYVTALRDANITGNRQLLHVVDQRTLPGEDTSFPLVRRLLSVCHSTVHHLDWTAPVYALALYMPVLGSAQ